MSGSKGIDFTVFAGLLEKLQSAPTRREKLTLLMRARGALARASVDERRMLGAAVGVRGIEKIVERLVASRSLAGNLVPLLERAGRIDPDRVVDLVEEFEEIREKEGRKGLMERGRELLERELRAAVSDDGPEGAVQSETPDVEASGEEAPVAAPNDESATKTPSGAAAPGVGDGSGELDRSDASHDELPVTFPGVASAPGEFPGAGTPLGVAPPVASLPERSMAASTRSNAAGSGAGEGEDTATGAGGGPRQAGTAPPADAATVDALPAAESDARADAHRDASEDRSSAQTPRHEPPRVTPIGAAALVTRRRASAERPLVGAAGDRRAVRERDASELVRRLAAEVHLVRRLQLLRRWMDTPGELSMPELTSVLESFPHGWSRRRALQSLLGGGAATKIEDCVELIGSLPSAADRLWCYGTLIDSRRLSAAEREILLEAANPGAERRRIARRLRLAAGRA